MSLRKALVCYVTAAAVLALALCAITSNLCDFLVKEIYEAYPETVEKYYLTNERGERLGDGSYVGRDFVPLSAKDQRMVDILRAFPGVIIPV